MSDKAIATIIGAILLFTTACQNMPPLIQTTPAPKSAATFQASFDPAYYSLPKMIAGYEIVAVISPENITCLPSGMIQLLLKAPQKRMEDFLKNNQPDVVQQELNELDVAHHGQWTLGFVGPAITRDLVISETEKWNAAMKAGCETFGVPEAITTPASD